MPAPAVHLTMLFFWKAPYDETGAPKKWHQGLVIHFCHKIKLWKSYICLYQVCHKKIGTGSHHHCTDVVTSSLLAQTLSIIWRKEIFTTKWNRLRLRQCVDEDWIEVGGGGGGTLAFLVAHFFWSSRRNSTGTLRQRSPPKYHLGQKHAFGHLDVLLWF